MGTQLGFRHALTPALSRREREECRFELLVDSHELIDAVGAGVAGADGFEAVGCEAAGEFGFVKDVGEVVFHFAAVAGDEVIFSRCEKFFGIVPGGTDQGNAAGEGFEDADGGDAGESFDVGASGDVDGDGESGESFGGHEIGEPAGVFDGGVGEGVLGVLWVADAVDAGAEAELANGLEEEFVELGGALIVAPVADPDEVALREN
jgi:hypothetical protein